MKKGETAKCSFPFTVYALALGDIKIIQTLTCFTLLCQSSSVGLATKIEE